MRLRRNLSVFLPAAAIMAAAASATTAVAAPSAAPRLHRSQLVNAIVVVRPGVHLPMQVPGGRVVAAFGHLGSELVRLPAADVDALARDSRVAGVSPDRLARVQGHDYGRRAPRARRGGHSDSRSVLASEFLGKVDRHSAHGYHVNVALLDTGVSNTDALNRASGRITDGVDTSRLSAGGPALTSGQFSDGYGHGTFLASLIAGGPVAGTHGQPVGVAPAARIVVVKVANDSGVTSLADVLAGMDWVAAHARAIQVVNVALSVARPTAPAYGADPMTAAVEHVRAAGVLVVAAAGNTPRQVGDPGMDPQSLTVGAADLSNDRQQVAPFSGSGMVAGVQKPDVVASGMHVLGLLDKSSQISRKFPSGWQSNGLFRGSGTSEATAITSGLAAVWFSDHVGATPLAAKEAIRSAAKGSHDARAGAGLIQMPPSKDNSHGNGHAHVRQDNSGESGFDAQSWELNAWQHGDWEAWLASSWSGPAWDASSWSAATWSASSWSASSWSASSWSASSWSASSWSASSWSASSWSASSWSAYGWGDSS